MLSHDQIWGAIDTLAQRYGFTASGLARKAGLDATTFNRSKRVAPDGRERWPSTESISKILVATGLTQGTNPKDYHYCVEGELVWIQEPCDRDVNDPSGPFMNLRKPVEKTVI